VEQGVGLAKRPGEIGALASLGHDLRTPLTIIHGYAQLLRSEELSPEQRAQACDLIVAKCQELNEVIRGFLEPGEPELPVRVAVSQTA
jgi:signal transduction histidine kinase